MAKDDKQNKTMSHKKMSESPKLKDPNPNVKKNDVKTTMMKKKKGMCQMTMIRPKIRGLKMTNPPKKSAQGTKIGAKGKGHLKGEFLGTSKMMS